MRTRQTITVSMPPAMVEQVKLVSEEEFRTPSELVREALRRYFVSRLPAAKVSAQGHRAIERGRAELTAGDYVSLEDLNNGVAGPNRKVSRKKTGKSSRQR